MTRRSDLTKELQRLARESMRDDIDAACVLWADHEGPHGKFMSVGLLPLDQIHGMIGVLLQMTSDLKDLADGNCHHCDLASSPTFGTA